MTSNASRFGWSTGREQPTGWSADRRVHFPFYWATGQINEIASWLTLGIAAYSAAAYGDPRRGRWVLGACVLAVTALALLPAVFRQPVGAAQVVAVSLFNAMPFLLGWTMGLMTRRLRGYRAILEERNRQLAAEREAGARRAVLEERVRIARELHDIVAHHVSVMGIQAAVARRLFDRSPVQAREAIGSVETASRQAIADLQQLVGVVRRREEPATWPRSRAWSGCLSWSSRFARSASASTSP